MTTISFEVSGEKREGPGADEDEAKHFPSLYWEWATCPSCGGHAWDIFVADYETYGQCTNCQTVKCLHSG